MGIIKKGIGIGLIIVGSLGAIRLGMSHLESLGRLEEIRREIYKNPDDEEKIAKFNDEVRHAYNLGSGYCASIGIAYCGGIIACYEMSKRRKNRLLGQ